MCACVRVLAGVNRKMRTRARKPRARQTAGWLRSQPPAGKPEHTHTLAQTMGCGPRSNSPVRPEAAAAVHRHWHHCTAYPCCRTATQANVEARVCALLQTHTFIKCIHQPFRRRRRRRQWLDDGCVDAQRCCACASEVIYR